jgi:hypothetical protein
MKQFKKFILIFNVIFAIFLYTFYLYAFYQNIFDGVYAKYVLWVFLLLLVLFVFIIFPWGNFIISRKIYHAKMWWSYAIHSIVYLSFLVILFHVFSRTSWYGMLHELEYYGLVERLFLQYPFLWVVVGFWYTIGLDILLRYVFDKITFAKKIE